MEFPADRSAEVSSGASLEGVGDNSANSNIETLPAKKAGVNRQSARSKECESDT